MIDNYCATLILPSSQGLPNVLGGSWMHLVFIGLLASAFLMVLVQMVGRGMKIPRLEAWSRHEFFQIAGTAGLAIFITFMLFGMCSFNVSFLAPDLYSGSAGQSVVASCGTLQNDSAGNIIYPHDASGALVVTPFCAAQSYLYKVQMRGQDVFQALIGLNGAMSYLFRLTWESRPLGIGYTLEPLAGFQQMQNIFLVAISGFMISFLSIVIQMRILDFMLMAVPFYFMPLGLLLRGFSPTREFGGALIGFAIASLFFYPLTLVLNDMVIYSSLDAVTKQVPALNAQLYPDSPVIRTFNGDVDLSGYTTGDTLTDPAGGWQLEVTNILDQGKDRLWFESGSSSQQYLARWETVNGVQQTRVYQINSIFNLDETGQTIQNNSGPYNDTLDSNGQPVLSTANKVNSTISYFTDPQTAGDPTSAESEHLATTLFWPTEMVMIFSVASILLPIIDLMIYIELARQLTRLFGAEMDLSNLTRMI